MTKQDMIDIFNELGLNECHTLRELQMLASILHQKIVDTTFCTVEQVEVYMSNKHKADIIQGALEARIEELGNVPATMDTLIWCQARIEQLKEQLSQEIMKGENDGDAENDM